MLIFAGMPFYSVWAFLFVVFAHHFHIKGAVRSLIQVDIEHSPPTHFGQAGMDVQKGTSLFGRALPQEFQEDFV